jgi:hypothetical protein
MMWSILSMRRTNTGLETVAAEGKARFNARYTNGPLERGIASRAIQVLRILEG